MGQVFQQFGNLRFNNEAEVSTKLVVPLLLDFLGYTTNEILPEHLQPAVKIPLNREKRFSGEDAKIRPDFMIALDSDQLRVIFSLDSKGPNESLDDHLQQLLAYCISVGKNLVAVTNGAEFRVYNANDLVFQAGDIAALDLQFAELEKLLHKKAAHIPLSERIRSLDDNLALGRSLFAIENEHRRQVALANSDFIAYLKIIANSRDEFSLPPSILEAFHIPLKRFPPQQLYTFLLAGTDLNFKPNEPRTYNHILQEISTSSILIVGESGIGKTSLLTEIARDYARACLQYESSLVPVLVKLGQYTSTNNLRVLISNQLGRGTRNFSESDVSNLLREKRIVLLLDAFDEVVDRYLHDLLQEIESILHDFQCAVVITTRHFRVPQVSFSKRYDLNPLTPQKIRAFSEMYLGTDSQNLLSEIIRKDLGNVVSNTLLLTLLILLYRNDPDLPRSRTQVIRAIVVHLEKWAQSKAIRRFQYELLWQIKVDILSKLATLSFMQGDSYSLGSEQANQTLVSILNDLEANRTVPRGMLIEDSYEQLEDTGLIRRQESGISFWHRAFQEYLASLQIAKSVESKQIQIDAFIKDPNWEVIFPSVALAMRNPEALISELLSHNVFIAGRAIVECNLEGGTTYERTVECLRQRCVSKQRAIRDISVNLLRQINGEYASKKFRELFEAKETEEYEHIRKIALVEIAKRGIPNAREIVYQHIDWYSYTNMDWLNEEVHAGAAVIEALSWFDDEESQRHIVERWMRNIDFPTRETCRDAIIRLANRGALLPAIKHILIEWFISDHSEDKLARNVVPTETNGRNKVDYSGVENALVAMHDVALVLKLIPALAVAIDRDAQYFSIIEVLKTFNEPEVVKAIIEQISLHKTNPVLCARFLDVLSEIEGATPVEVFWEFVQAEIPSAAKAYAIRGLRRLPFNKIEDAVLAAIHPPSYERLLEFRQQYLIQEACRKFSNSEIIQMMTSFAGSPNLRDDTRIQLQRILVIGADASSLLRELVRTTTALPNTKWDITSNREHFSSQGFRHAIMDLLYAPPLEDLLISDPCDYGRLQDEVFQVLGKHGKIALLAKSENRLPFLYNISSETLFQIIRRDKVYEMEPFISSFIARRIDDKHVVGIRMVIDATWVLAELGQIQKAQQFVEKISNRIDLSTQEGTWSLGDILKGIHLLPSDYAVAEIEKAWSKIKSGHFPLLPSYCIQALGNIGTKRAMDMLTRIADETMGQSEYLLVPEEALRVIQSVSPTGRDEWLVGLLQNGLQDRHFVQRAVHILGMMGSLRAFPTIQRYFESDPNEKTRYIAFWSLHNLHKVTKELWYNGEEAGCK